MASVPFNNLITFSRGSNATLTGSNGLIQWAPNNLVTNSESFDAASWNKSGTTVTANVTAAPDGTSTADRVTKAATSFQSVFTSVTAVAGAAYTVSAYFKSDTLTKASITVISGTTDVRYWFDLATKTVGGALPTYTTGYISSSIEDVGNGWLRCTLTVTAQSAATNAYFYPDKADNAVAGSVYLWGAQLELGSAATTYNSTTVKNLLGFSEAFDNAAWNKNNASIVTGAQANPVNGAFNAQKLMEDTSTNLHRVSQVPTLTAAAHTASIYAKSAGRNWLYMANASLSQAAYFNLNTGTIGTIVGATTATITPAGNGWYRCSITSTPSAGAQNYSFYTANADASFSYTGDGNSGVYIYGAQLSDSASLDPYVPTPAAAPSSTAYYGPRFDYDPVTLAPKGLLIEEARTNLLTYSQDFTNAAYIKAAGTETVTADAGVAPDGTTTADQITTLSTNGLYRASIPVTTATSYTASVFVKRVAGSNTLDFGIAANPATGTTVFNINTGTVTSNGASVTASSITPVGNGWYRLSVTAVTTSTTVVLIYYSTSAATWLQYGAQLEAGAFATSYIPTVASTVTRSADVATINGSLFSQWYNQPQGTVVVSFSGPGSYAVAMNDGGNDNYIGIANNGVSLVGGFTGVAAVQRVVSMPSNPAGTVNNTAFVYRVNDLAGSTNGGTAVTNATSAIPTVTRLVIGAYSGFGYLNGHIRSINFIPARAADFQLQALTS